MPDNSRSNRDLSNEWDNAQAAAIVEGTFRPDMGFLDTEMHADGEGSDYGYGAAVPYKRDDFGRRIP